MRESRIFFALFCCGLINCGDEPEPEFELLSCSAEFGNECCNVTGTCCYQICNLDDAFSNPLDDIEFSLTGDFATALLTGTFNATYPLQGPWSATIDGGFGSIGPVSGGLFTGSISGSDGIIDYSCSVGAMVGPGIFSMNCTGSNSLFSGGANYSCFQGGLFCTGGINFNNDDLSATCGAGGTFDFLGLPITTTIQGTIQDGGSHGCGINISTPLH